MHAYRCTPVDAEPSIHARIYIHPYAHARGDGCSQTQMEPPMRVCVCASGHPYTPRCTSVDTDARCTDGHTTPPRAHTRTHTFTQTWILYMHSYLSICAHTYTYICKSCGRARPRRSRRALTRTYAHAHTRRHVLYICSLTYTYGLEHTLIYMYIVTHN